MKLELWTMPDSYFGEVWPCYYVFLSQARDSDALTRSNFAVALARLGGESETVEVVHERHWALGWLEWIAIHQDDVAAVAKAEAMLEALEQYPVLDEEHFYQLEESEDADD